VTEFYKNIKANKLQPPWSTQPSHPQSSQSNIFQASKTV